MFQPKPDVPLWARDKSRAPYYRARDGSGYAAWGKGLVCRRRRGLAAQETTAPAFGKPAFPEPHLSGQPGSRLMNTPQREQSETMRHV